MTLIVTYTAGTNFPFIHSRRRSVCAVIGLLHKSVAYRFGQLFVLFLFSSYVMIRWIRLDLCFNLRKRVRCLRSNLIRPLSILEGWNTIVGNSTDSEKYLIGHLLTCRSYKCLNCGWPEVYSPAVCERRRAHADYKNIRFASRWDTASYVRRPLRPGLSRSHNYLLSSRSLPLHWQINLFFYQFSRSPAGE